MELAQVMRTSGAVRDFTDEPVPSDVLFRVLDNARFAPSGGNQQGWHVTIVRDPAKRRRLAELHVTTFRRYLAERLAGFQPYGVVDPAPADLEIRHEVATEEMAVTIEHAAELLLLSIDLRTLAVLDRDLDRHSIVAGGSIYPFAQNILLAARDEGLGGALTTFVVASEAEVARVLNLPPHHALAAMIQLGRPRRQLTRLTRHSVASFATIDTFDGDALSGG